jgi:hypothetical protein
MIKKEDYINAIHKSRGLLTAAADALGCTRGAIYEAAKKHPEIQRAIEEARERTTDVAEGKLFQKINEGDNTAIIFYLKTQGKKRGYVERQEVTGAEGTELTVRVIRE